MQKYSSSPVAWHLRWHPVCSSTELLLSKWLEEKPFLNKYPRAVLACRQRHARGQRGRVWHAPRGGVWISAALPWPSHVKTAGIFGLAVALAIASSLERYGVKVKIKWPNDLIVGEKKLLGLLPGFVLRGENVRIARIGIGFNITNKVPLEGVALSELLPEKSCQVEYWSAEVLFALEKAINFIQNTNFICTQVEKRLWLNEIIEPNSGKFWEIEGISPEGGLKLKDGIETLVWNRWP